MEKRTFKLDIGWKAQYRQGEIPIELQLEEDTNRFW